LVIGQVVGSRNITEPFLKRKLPAGSDEVTSNALARTNTDTAFTHPSLILSKKKVNLYELPTVMFMLIGRESQNILDLSYKIRYEEHI
jgi:hypothetical protein